MQVTLLMDAAGTKELEELPDYKELLQFFITPEVRCCLAANHAPKNFAFTSAVAMLVCIVPAATTRSACIWLRKEGVVVQMPLLI